MLQLSDKGLRQLVIVFTISLLLGGLAILGLGIHLIVMGVQGTYSLPLVLFEGLQLAISVQASSLGSYVLYCLLLIACLTLGLLMLFLVRSMLISLEREKAFTQSLPLSIKRIAYLMLVLAYAKQLLFLLAFQQDLGKLTEFVSFRFQLLPTLAVYALVVLVFSQLFSYGLILQREYEQTV
jgi:hypothetical protein